MARRSIFRKINHKAFYALALLVLIALGLTYYFYSYRPNHSPTKVVTAGTPAVSSHATTSKPVEKSVANNAGTTNSGGATDTHGSTPSSNPTSQWTTSASGVITVKSPAPNSTIKDGDSVSGSSSAGEINYRLSDNKVGVIAQGTLSVEHGNFSGILHFQPRGTGGRLDVFTTNAQGVEYNEVQINLNF